MTINNRSSVEFVRDELVEITPKYDLIRTLLKGEQALKDAGTKYLPAPNGDVNEEEERYQDYVARAVLHNVTDRTEKGLKGQVFLRNPQVELPEIMEIFKTDANGANISLTQLAKKAVGYTIAYGRAGLFTDYPSVGTEVTREDIASGRVRPVINLYAPWDIINWRREKIDGKSVLTLVVLREIEERELDFRIYYDRVFRVLRLIRNAMNEVCVSVTIWRETLQDPGNPESKHMVEEESYFLCDSEGNNLDRMPFEFIGSENNDDIIDEPPLYDIATLNVGHWRNSADFEESAFMLGQPTPYFAGLTVAWVNNFLGDKIVLGSRSAVPLPENASAGLLQAQPNTLASEGMERKEKQMVALGAKLIQERQTERTATEAEFDNASETSVLSTISKNNSSAFTNALKWAANFIGEDSDSIVFELNSNFDLSTMTAEEIRITIESWIGGAILTDEMREALKRSGLTSVDLEEYTSKIKGDSEFKKQNGIVPDLAKNNGDNRTKVNDEEPENES